MITPEEEAQFIRLAVANGLVVQADIDRCRELLADSESDATLPDVLVSGGFLSEVDRRRVEKTIEAQKMKSRRVSFPGEGSVDLRYASAAVHLKKATLTDASRVLRRIDAARKEGEHLSNADAFIALGVFDRAAADEIEAFLAGPGEAEGAFRVLKIFAQFEILHHLSAGAMGVVYRARDLELDKVVALKILSLGKDAPPEAIARFYQEVKTLGSIEHPLLVDIHTAGDFRGWHYYSMDYVEGPSLAKEIADRGVLDVEEALVLTRELCRSVGALHEAGFLHRDIKPSNVILDRTRTVNRETRTGTTTWATPSTPGEEVGIPAPILIDFGVVKKTDHEGVADLDETDEFLGTPGYMSPEHAQNTGLDRRSDVFSLGVLLYHMLTGSPPFAGGDPMAVVTRLFEEEVEMPSERRAGLDPEVDAIVLKAIARQRSDRYYSTGHLAADIDRYFRGEEIEAPIRRTPVANLRTLTALAAAGLSIVVLFFGFTILGYRQVEISSEAEVERKRADDLDAWRTETLATLAEERAAATRAGRLDEVRRRADWRARIEPRDPAIESERKKADDALTRFRTDGPRRVEQALTLESPTEAARELGRVEAFLGDDPTAVDLRLRLAGPPRIGLAERPEGLRLVLLPVDASRPPVALGAGSARGRLPTGRYRARIGGPGALPYEFLLAIEPGTDLVVEALRLAADECPSRMAFLPRIERTSERAAVGGGQLVALRDVTHLDLGRFRWIESASRTASVLLTGPATRPALELRPADREAYLRWTNTRPIDGPALERLLEATGVAPEGMTVAVAGLRLACEVDEARFAASVERARGESWRQRVGNGPEPAFVEPGPLLVDLRSRLRSGGPSLEDEARRTFLAAGLVETVLYLKTGRTPEFGHLEPDLAAALDADRPAEIADSLSRTIRSLGRSIALVPSLPGAAHDDPGRWRAVVERAAAVDPAGGAWALQKICEELRLALVLFLEARRSSDPARLATDLAWSSDILETQDLLVGDRPLQQSTQRVYRALELLFLGLDAEGGDVRLYGYQIAARHPLPSTSVYGQMAEALAAMAEIALTRFP